jgi:hypothetical protein
MVSTHGFTGIGYHYHQQNHNQGICKQDLLSIDSILFPTRSAQHTQDEAMPTQVGVFN